MRQVSVIIPQHGYSRLTLHAVESFQRMHPDDVEILIVDDGSDIHERRLLQSSLRGKVSMVRVPRRRGVTAAWNAGAMAASGGLLVFLNNDTVSQGAWLTALIDPLLQGTHLLTAPGWRQEPELAGSARKLLVGWCLAVRRETFFEAGRFDERFQLYFSDTDLQLQLLRISDTALHAVSGLPLQHLGHCSTRQLTSRSLEWRLDRLQFLKKWNLKKAD